MKPHFQTKDNIKQELSGSFEIINNDVEQDFSGSNGTGNIKNNRFFFCLLILKYMNFVWVAFGCIS